ncbi:MAG: PsbP-related protein [Patescibacteria group bacterium]
MNQQKGFANIVLIVLVVILTGIAGYFVLVKKPVSPTTETNQPQATTQTNTTSQDEMANWKTYTDSQNGYSLKYPGNWTVNASSNELFIRSPRANTEAYPYSILIQSYRSSYPIPRQAFEFLVLPQLRKDIDHQLQDINFNGYSAVSFFDLGIFESKNIVVVPNNIVHLVPQDGGAVKITYSTSTGNDSLTIDQIISTFKFTR